MNLWDWILDHWQLIVVVGGAIATWLNQRRREKMGQPADYDEDGVPDNRPTGKPFAPETMDGEEAERTRRIQEDIRRKIAERAGTPTEAPPLVAPRPVATPLPPVPARRVVPPPLPSQEEEEAMQARQRTLAEQMRELDVQRAEAKRRASEARVLKEEVRTGVSSAPSTERDFLADLRDPASARKAMVLREVLGTPVGLR